jgi:PmbA protein
MSRTGANGAGEGALRELGERALAAARAAGADEADLRLVAGREFTAQVRLGEIEVLKEATSRALELRVFKEQRLASVALCAPTAADLAGLAEEAVALAASCAPDPLHRLPEPGAYATATPELELRDAGGGPAAATGIALARELEAAAMAADPRIDNSQGASFASGEAELLYMTSNGFAERSAGSQFSLSVMPLATDRAGERVTDGWAKRSRHFADLDSPAALGAEAARRVLRRLDARPAPTGRFPVLFEPRMAARLVGMLWRCIAGDLIWRGRSYLAERLGTAVASPLITLIDEPLRPRGLGSRPWDGEGLPGRRLALVEAGVFAHIATDLESARRLGRPATGHGVWGGGVAASNLYLAPGATSPAAMLAATPRGLVVTGMLGGGFQSASGHWSQGCTGLWIEGGEIAYPVREVAVAGNLEQILGAVDAVGDDLDFSLGAVVAPTLRVAELTVGSR